MYFILFCTLLIGLSEAQKPLIPLPAKLVRLILEKSPECLAKTGARPEVMLQFFTIPVENDETTKTYNLCLFKSMGLSNDAGHFNLSKVLALYENYEDNEILRVARTTVECNLIVAESPTETMYRGLQCFAARAPAWISY